MSIKATRAYSDGTDGCPAFHLWQNAWDLQDIMLEMRGEVHFSATPEQVNILIPVAVWNRIIAIGPIPPAESE